MTKLALETSLESDHILETSEIIHPIYIAAFGAFEILSMVNFFLLWT